MYPPLLSIHEGEYVAVLEGRVVDSDADERTLMQRVYQKFGYQPMYVQRSTKDYCATQRIRGVPAPFCGDMSGETP
jgi:hypothetical protein